ncbi:MAG: glycoside hydrolase family 3 C-terminal domain-containing protein [Chitinispirillaceae bacterium]|nr:glycoside hydrolase family 3 C-terminal domain-containing protein [Chitinispirillaceae bacterium]
MSVEPGTSARSYEDAIRKAETIVSTMTLEEKVDYLGGHNHFFIKGVENHNLPRLYLADATQGVHLRKNLDGQLEKSTSFPAPIALAASWNTQLAGEYARCVGEECRAGGVAVLLGPGMNIYRNAQNGRNFEYFGEDPFLAARMIEQYVRGVQNTGTVATLKHFACNNTDHRRRTSNSVVDERTLHEIYLPAFKAGIDAGAMAVMTSYNQINGEWAGQSGYVISEVLRKQLGFKWLVMTDWWSIWDPVKAIRSGLDLDMPGHGRKGTDNFDDFGNPFLRGNAKRLVEEGSVSENDIHRMARNVIAVSVAMEFDKRPMTDTSLLEKFPEHLDTALQCAREGIVLLKNSNALLPLAPGRPGSLLLTGQYADLNACGGGAANVEGYDNITMRDALLAEFGDAVTYRATPTEEELRSAEVVLLSIGTEDSEGWDSPFELPDATNELILHAASLNSNVVVIMNTGRGVGMTKWVNQVAGLLYCWYPGQIGNVALAEILSGKTNPSGKLPITIEKRYEDSPAFPGIPDGDAFYTGWDEDFDINRPVHDIRYDEGVFVGYRWYEKKKIEPLFPFGFGLSFTTFALSDLLVTQIEGVPDERVRVQFTVKNTGAVAGAHVCQVYLHDHEASVPRPLKELKGFRKVYLKPGEERTITIGLRERDFAFYDVTTHGWRVEPGVFTIMAGSSSVDLPLGAEYRIDKSSGL